MKVTEKEKHELDKALMKLKVAGFAILCIMCSLIYTAIFYGDKDYSHSQDNLISEVFEEDDSFWYGPEEDLEPLVDSVLMTWYNPVESQCDSDPFITADMSEIILDELENRDIRWIAVSRDLLDKYSMGDTVIIESSNPRVNGEWVIHDKMNKRFTNRIDLLVAENDEYYNLRMPKNVTIRKV